MSTGHGGRWRGLGKAGRVLMGRVRAARVLAGRVLAGRVLAGRVLAGALVSVGAVALVSVGAVPMAGCGAGAGPGGVGGEAHAEAGPANHAPAGNARVVLDEARRELADPERMPLRQGMRIDREGLRRALLDLRSKHGEAVAVAYQASLEALPQGERPAAPRFVEVAAFSLPDEPAAREVEAVNWLLDANVRQTVQRVLATYLTLVMVKDVGMTTEEVGIWMAFLRAAEPELRRCGAQGPGLLLCVDYGDDVFLLDMERHDPAWVVTRLRWMQAQSE